MEQDTFVLPSPFFAKTMTYVYHGEEDWNEWLDYARSSLAMGIDKGVKLVAGDDFGMLEMPNGDNAKELALYVEDLGLPPLEIIKWATANGAEMSQIPDTRRIATGTLADLVVVDGDPLQRIGVLSEPDKIVLVMKGGEIAKASLVSRSTNDFTQEEMSKEYPV